MSKNKKIKNLYLFELSDIFAHQVYLPYSSGVVWSYLNGNKTIKENYKLQDWFYARDDASNIIADIVDPDYLLFSSFMWNWNLNCEIAQAIKVKYPSCMMVFGGQHQPLPDRNDGFFQQFPFIDVLIHGEGEATLEEILLNPYDLKHINGITLNMDGKEFKSPPRARLDEIDDSPSPYLDGSFDWIMEKNKKDKNYSFHATVESARGCPYSCAFCEIGEKYYQKIKTSYDKTKREIEWCARNKIEYVTDANSNFGIMFDHDYDLAQYVVDTKEKYEYPHAYRVTWAKGRAGKVLKIADLFEQADVQKGMTIAIQSLNPKVLKAIKRQNVDGGKLQEFIEMYESAGIASYVELIWGLPEETIDTFKDGVCQIMEYGYHNYLDIHLMMLLPNAPISEPGYKEQYGLKTTETQPRFSHRSNPEQLVNDTVSFVTKANSFTTEEWIEGHQFRWIVIFGHYLGPLQFIARALHSLYKISYIDFYTFFLNFAKNTPSSFLGTEYRNIKQNLNKILKNKRHWGDVIKGVGDINWEVEEASCIRLLDLKDRFYDEIVTALQNLVSIDEKILFELIKYQKLRLHTPCVSYPISENFSYNIHEVIENGDPIKRYSKDKNIGVIGKTHEGDKFNWAKETLWFGRRLAKYKTQAI